MRHVCRIAPVYVHCSYLERRRTTRVDSSNRNILSRLSCVTEEFISISPYMRLSNSSVDNSKTGNRQRNTNEKALLNDDSLETDNTRIELCFP